MITQIIITITIITFLLWFRIRATAERLQSVFSKHSILPTKAQIRAKPSPGQEYTYQCFSQHPPKQRTLLPETVNISSAEESIGLLDTKLSLNFGQRMNNFSGYVCTIHCSAYP